MISRLGDADLHKIVLKHDKLYGFDAVLGAMLISTDDGRTFEEQFTPRGLIIDFEVDPEDPDRIFAATDNELFRSEDGGKSWRAAYRGEGSGSPGPLRTPSTSLRRTAPSSARATAAAAGSASARCPASPTSSRPPGPRRCCSRSATAP